MFSSNEEVKKYLKDSDVEFVDVRFIDLPGVMQHFNMPTSAFDDAAFEDGLMFDGSSIRGFQAINESDMKLLPDPLPRSLPQGQDPGHELRGRRPLHGRALQP